MKLWMNIASAREPDYPIADITAAAADSDLVDVYYDRTQTVIGHVLRYEMRGPDLWAFCEVLDVSAEPVPIRAAAVIDHQRRRILAVMVTRLARELLPAVGAGLTYDQAVRFASAKQRGRS